VGDRSAIVIHSEQYKTPITFYGHWSGEQNIEAVKNVLARTGRVGDPSYLTAQIFYEFAIRLGNYDGEYSFGIDTFGADGVDSVMDRPTIYVNADTGKYSTDGLVFDT